MQRYTDREVDRIVGPPYTWHRRKTSLLQGTERRHVHYTTSYTLTLEVSQIHQSIVDLLVLINFSMSNDDPWILINSISKYFIFE